MNNGVTFSLTQMGGLLPHRFELISNVPKGFSPLMSQQSSKDHVYFLFIKEHDITLLSIYSFI